MSNVRIENYVEGNWATGTGVGAELQNPATEEVLGHADTSGIDFARTLEFARREGGPALRALSFAERGEMLQRMSTALHTAREALIDSAVANGGCTRSDAKFDVDGAIGTLAAYAEIGKQVGAARILADGDGIQLGRSPKFWGQHLYLPKPGAAVCINAFNFPTWGFAEKAACALLAGMPVVTKPATATALTAFLAAQVLIQAQCLPRGAFSFIGGSAGKLLDHLGPQDVLAFTGSADTAQQLRANALARGASINVEADSLNAAILGPDAEPGSEPWNMFLKELVKDVTQKTGQKCTAIRRVLVPQAVLKDVEGELAARFGEIRIGDPARSEVGMGPLATRQQLASVRAGVQKLLGDADVVFGDPTAAPAAVGVPAGKGYFHPIVLLRARQSASAPAVHSHEVFGPVTTLLPYDGSADEATALVAAGGGGLVSSIYTDDRRFAEALVLGIGPYHGRLYFAGTKVLDQTMGPGTVLPSCTHGGPGRAGGGEELGGLRGVQRFMQRTAVQGYRPLVEAIAGKPA